MNRRMLLTLVLAGLAALMITTAVAAGSGDLAQVRRANSKYRSTAAAQADGYDLIPGLDYCFNNPGVGAMGFHYIRAAALDLALDPLQPEAMVYSPEANGRLRLAAVEYIVPAADWDAAHPGEMPMLLGQHLHLNEKLGVYVLHAWLWKSNPRGVFSDWNPKVSCP